MTAALEVPASTRRISIERPASLAVVVVTYNSGEVLPGLLDSLPAGLEGIENARIIIADNDSRDASPEIAAFHATRPELVRMGRNAGYSAAINAAAELAGPDSDLLILNPDIRLGPGSVARLRDKLQEPENGITVPQILEAGGEVALSVRRTPSLLTGWMDALLGTGIAARIGIGEIVRDPQLYRDGGPVEWATGAALLVSAQTRRLVGEWDESFFLYSEEVDYLERVNRAGLLVQYVPTAQVIHIGGAYQNNPFLSALMTTNRIRYYRRHHGVLATALFRLSIIFGETLRSGLGRGHRAALRAALTPG